MKKTGKGKWDFERRGEFYKELAQVESTLRPEQKNEIGYLGLYQMGEPAMVDAGYYERQPTTEAEKKTKFIHIIIIIIFDPAVFENLIFNLL